MPSSHASPVALQDRGRGVFSLCVAHPAAGNALVPELVLQLRGALEAAAGLPALKVLVLEGSATDFLHGATPEHNEAVAQGLYSAIAGFPRPVIAAMRGAATGAGLLVGALCDLMVCSEEASYGFTLPESGRFPTQEEVRLFDARFGRVQAADLLYHTVRASGRQWRVRGWNCAIVPAQQVESHALALASQLAGKPADSLRLLKQHLSQPMQELAAALRPLGPARPRAPLLHDRAQPGAAGRHLRLEVAADDVLLLRLCKPQGPCESGALLAELGTLLERIAERDSCRALVLASEHPDFLPLPGDAAAFDAVRALGRMVHALPLPVIAALDVTATGKGWLVAQCCDAVVHAKEGVYGIADCAGDAAWMELAGRILAQRFGDNAARAIVLGGAAWKGPELARGIGPLPVAPRERLVGEAVRLAAQWARLPQDALMASRRGDALAQRGPGDLAPAPVAADSREAGEPTPVLLASEVVTAQAHPDGVLVVRMQDRGAKNLFSPAFVEGMNEVFRHIDETPGCKVVVLTGYDNYFACGGTREALEAIQAGRARFTDEQTYLLALSCRVPVIAAMQGHGVGGGLSLGLFADLVLLGEESMYLSPYLDYGFTPGAGATLIVPEKLGRDLGVESLFTAREFAGGEWRARGVPVPVHPRGEVLEAALALAHRMARETRDTLIRLKKAFNASIHARLERNTQQEIAMHEQSFVGHNETLVRIQANFHPGHEAAAVPPEPPVAAPQQAPALPEVIACLKRLLAQELHMQPDDVDEDAPFIDLGLDSITGVTWMRKVNESYGTAIQATQVYSHPTLTRLGPYVHAEIARLVPQAAPAEPVPAAVQAEPGNAASDPAPRAAAPSQPRRTGRKPLASWRHAGTSRADAVRAAPALEPIAVIGMAGQFAKARNVDEYWANIAQGRDCVSEIPATRWDVDAHYQQGEPVPGKTNSRWMGQLEDYDLFDPAFFEISPKEAMSMDPQQRVFLQACWQAIESAGLDARSLAGSRCGVFVGCGPGDYHLLSRDLQTSALGFTGGDTAILAARVSYFLDLRGPCLAIETACSSSLVALATACDSLVAGNSDIALAGGVCVMTGPEVHLKMAQTGMLSPDGRCFTFDERANGFAPGEGVGTLVLKRLSDAERDHDEILGVIRGWGVNQDGKTNGITAPNPDAQSRLQQEVYERFGIDPAAIELVEAHGTGTRLGDPIEVNALKQAFGQPAGRKNYCALGSVKSNIGHCFTAAGAASVIKVLQALRHRQLPPTINFARLNAHIALQDSPFYVNDRLLPWEAAGPQGRLAAVSGFGFGGTNAHVVIGEYVAPVAPGPAVSVLTENGRLMVPLSARTAGQLRSKAADLLEFLAREGRSVDLVAMAYTLQAGRTAMDERLCFLAGSAEELAGQIEAFLADDRAGAGTFQGNAREHKEAMGLLRRHADLRDALLEKALARRALSELADLWVRGLEMDWNRLYGGARPRRIALPLYPFARERYWIASGRPAQAAGELPVASSPHPTGETRRSAVPAIACEPARYTRERLQRELRESLAQALFVDAAGIAVDKPFIELGLDSIVGVEWVHDVNKRYQVKIAATTVYDHPTIAALAAFLEAQLAQAAPAPAPAMPCEPEPSPPAGRAAADALDRGQAQLLQELKESLADALFLQAAELPVDKPFIELGLDSVVGVEWVHALNRKYGVKITATKLYDHPTLQDLASCLLKEGATGSAPAPVQEEAPPPRPSAAAGEKIAIIGMSGRYPQAGNLERFWDNLAHGRDAITEVPASRWDVASHYDPDPKQEGKTYCKWIGMLDDIEYFDPLFFRISPAEAKNMDPQHRMFLEEAYRAFEDAGYAGKDLGNRKCGVYLGNIGAEYAALVSNADDITGNNPAIGAARIAYFLNLKGPAISIDTACSASLVAIHLACQALLNHETDMALAGGASIWLHPETYAGMCRAGMLSPEGRCKTFDNGANGFVPGEGVGAVVLKRLSDAERDNDVIHGVILGSGINQDGRTNGITAPSVSSQVDLERDVYARHGIDPATIGYVETHGTGTKLGDPIELEALATVFRERTAKRRFCGLGSVKSNIGHASGAAGVASLHKVLLCMRHRMLVPTLHVTQENALFDFADSPFYVSREARPWEVSPGTRRRAAVSSFGFSGTNAHLVIEEYVPPAGQPAGPAPRVDAGVLVVLSARSPEQLQQRARDLLHWLQQEDRLQAVDVAALACTLFAGRDAMDERLAIVVRSAEQLASSLQRWLAGGGEAAGVRRARVERDGEGEILLARQQGTHELVRQCLERRDLDALADLWTRGLELEWSTLYAGAVPRRISLPTYPFARKRCWVDTPRRERRVPEEQAAPRVDESVLHPLVHGNVSVLGQQSYRSVFRGDESFLVAHAGQKLLPAVACLEMARVAVADALAGSPAPRALELRDIAWGRPIAATQSRQVNIILSRNSEERTDFEIYSLGSAAEAGADEIVHCQGYAAFVQAPPAVAIDLAALESRMQPGVERVVDGGVPVFVQRGERELLVRLPAPVGDRCGAFLLHPDTVNCVLAAAADLMAAWGRRPVHPAWPFALATARLHAAAEGEVLAWIRVAADGLEEPDVLKVDVDLCDRTGRACAQLRGLAFDVVPVREAAASTRAAPVIVLVGTQEPGPALA